MQAVQAKIENNNLGSYEFWRIANAILKRGKPSVPSFINDLEVVSSLCNELNSTLDNKENSLFDTPPLPPHGAQAL